MSEKLTPFSIGINTIDLVQAKVFQQVVVVGGGSLAKLGMKFQAFLEHDLEILDPKALEAQLNNIVGVVTNGLFAIRPADILIIGTPNGAEQIVAA